MRFIVEGKSNLTNSKHATIRIIVHAISKKAAKEEAQEVLSNDYKITKVTQE